MLCRFVGCQWLFLLLLFFDFPHASSASCYPPSPERPVVDRLHDVDVVDSYRWLEESNSIEVAQWTQAQNSLSEMYFQRLSQRKWIAKRLYELASSERTQVREVFEGERRFTLYKSPDYEQAVLFWQEDSQAEKKLLIDPNRWGDGQELRYYEPSRDGRYVAYGVAKDGSECPELFVIEVESGQILSDTVRGRKAGWPGGMLAWLPDHSGFYYGALPPEDEVDVKDREYWYTIYVHTLGTDASEDRQVFAHPTVREYFHSVSVSEKGDYALFRRQAMSSDSSLYIQFFDDEAPLKKIVEGREASYEVAFAGEKIVLVTNDEAANFKAYFVDPKNPDPQEWKTFLPEDVDRLIAVKAVAGHFYAEYLHHAQVMIRVYDGQGNYLHTLPLDVAGSAYVDGSWGGNETWVYFSSFIHPLSRYRYDPNRRHLDLVDAGNPSVDSSRFDVKQVWYPSKDGTCISMFLISEKQQCGCGPRPTLLTGYGGFGVSITPNFIDHYIPFLEAGGLLAIPNLRGGGEYGKTWHDAGCRENKQNVFDDFIAAAEWLIGRGYTCSDCLATRGSSNGGLLVGATMTQRPDLFRAVLCEVPLLDMLRYHRFGFANIWADEYGSAENREQFSYLYRYSPYHQVCDGVAYPAVLLRGAENDARTDALHVRKMIARLQAADPRGYIKLGVIDKAAGHQGGATLADRVSQKASSLAFIMDQLGMSERAP